MLIQWWFLNCYEKRLQVFRVRWSFRAGIRICHANKWPMLLGKCLTGSFFSVGLVCSLQRFSKFFLSLQCILSWAFNPVYHTKRMFLNSVIHQFFTPKNHDSLIIPSDLFEESEPFTLVEVPYCEEKENASKHFINNFEAFTNHLPSHLCYRIAMKWITRKVKWLFKVKSKNPHPSCVIYRGKFSCGEEHIREIERNVEKHSSELKNATKKTESARHLSSSIGHLFVWEILLVF